MLYISLQGQQEVEKQSFFIHHNCCGSPAATRLYPQRRILPAAYYRRTLPTALRAAAPRAPPARVRRSGSAKRSSGGSKTPMRGRSPLEGGGVWGGGAPPVKRGPGAQPPENFQDTHPLFFPFSSPFSSFLPFFPPPFLSLKTPARAYHSIDRI